MRIHSTWGVKPKLEKVLSLNMERQSITLPFKAFNHKLGSSNEICSVLSSVYCLFIGVSPILKCILIFPVPFLLGLIHPIKKANVYAKSALLIFKAVAVICHIFIRNRITLSFYLLVYFYNDDYDL